MSSAQDPFYIVKEEIQDSVNTLQATFRQWEHIPVASGEQTRLTKELLSNCDSIEWQVDELEKAISVAARDPLLYGIDQAELERRSKWTKNTRTQSLKYGRSLDLKGILGHLLMTRVCKQKVSNVKTTVTGAGSFAFSGMRQELMRVPSPRHTDKASRYVAKDNDDFISSESDRQMLLIRRQDEELDELSASVGRIGSVGLTIHDELRSQDKLLDELGTEMDSTTNRLDFVQKKVAVVMKKASAKGQMMMICFLIILFVVLFVLVFFT